MYDPQVVVKKTKTIPADQIDSSRAEILHLVSQFAAKSLEPSVFQPGDSPVPVSGKVLTPEDFVALVDSSLDGWLTAGRYHEEFQRALAKYVGSRGALMVNSGSSANLVALSALTSPKLGKKALKPGDEVLTVAMGFPTTVNPIIQNGLKPVMVDVQLETYDAISDRLREAVGPKTRAIMMAHTLGNPFDLDVAGGCQDVFAAGGADRQHAGGRQVADRVHLVGSDRVDQGVIIRRAGGKVLIVAVLGKPQRLRVVVGRAKHKPLLKERHDAGVVVGAAV